MVREDKNSTADKINQDFTPDSRAIAHLTKLKNFCDNEIKICEKIIEDIQNPDNQDLLKLNKTLVTQQQEIEKLNQELLRERDVHQTKQQEFSTVFQEKASITNNISSLENKIYSAQQELESNQKILKEGGEEEQSKKIETLKKTLEQKQDEYKTRQQELPTISAQENDSIERNIKSLQEQLNTSHEKLDMIERAKIIVKDNPQKIDTLSKQLLQQQNALLMKPQESSTSSQRNIAHNIRMTDVDIFWAKNELEKSTRILREGEEEEQRQKIKTLKKELEQKQDEYKTKQQEFKASSQEKDSIERNIKSLQDQINMSHKKLDVIQRAIIIVQENPQKIETLKKELKQKQDEYKTKQQEFITISKQRNDIVSNIQSIEFGSRKTVEALQKTNEQIRQNLQKESTRKNLQEAMKNPKHPLAWKVNQITQRKEMASKASDLINQAINKEREYYSVERNDNMIVANNIISAIRAQEKPGYYWTMENMQNASKTYLEDYITYATHPHVSVAFEIFLKNAEKLAKARNDDERYQPLKDIMDAMIIMLAKASSMFMPPAVVDITIKALGIIGGHLADIIREDFEKISKQPNNSVKLDEFTKKKEELEISIKNMQSVAKEKENEIMLKLTEQAVMLGLLGRSNYDTTEEFIKQLEGSIKVIRTNDDQGKKLKLAGQFKTEGGIELLCEQATENIKLYRDGQTASKEMQQRVEELKNLDKNIEQTNKSSERKSTKEMIKEVKQARDKTFTAQVRAEQKAHQGEGQNR